MRYVIIIIALMSISLLSAGIFDSTITFPLVTVNPSSTSKALGDVTGVANIWSGDPLNVWSNPALVAFHEGIRIGYMHDLYADDYTDNMGYNKYYQNVAIGSFAKNGLGISVPLPNYNGKIGNTFDYNLSTSGDYKPYMYDTVSEISLAFNPYQFAWNKKSEASEQCFDASVGISVNILSSRYYLDVISEDSFSSHNEHIHGDATEINGGLLLRFDGAKYFHLQNLELQGTFGMAGTNLSNSNFKYKYEGFTGVSRTLPQDYRFGAGMYVGLPIRLIEKDNTAFTAYCPHFMSIVFLSGKLAFIDNSAKNGYGMEMGLLDILYFRLGSCNTIGDIDMDNCTGWGLKLHQKGKWEFQYNSASFNTSSMIDLHSQDIAVVYHF